MSAREINKVGVVGLGTMGAGIAQLCIQAGVPTVACENTPELAERGRAGDHRRELQEAAAVHAGAGRHALSIIQCEAL